jgi:hypothetical protein
LEDKKYSMPMKYILRAIRLKMWESLEGLDAKRLKQNRVSIENCPPGVFQALVLHLGKSPRRMESSGTCFGGRIMYLT